MNFDIDSLSEKISLSRKAYTGFLHNVMDFFVSDNSDLFDSKDSFCVHSIKNRIKSEVSLKNKISRKIEEGKLIDSTNVQKLITDFCGIRVLHLRMDDFIIINKAINKHSENGHWVFSEPPKAYTWDPEYKEFFERQGIHTEIKPSFYTSVHYLVKPNEITDICCEIQVRTLFEEIWGEIDHDLNYPEPTENSSQREQLKVLAKLVGAGVKLIDSIYKS